MELQNTFYVIGIIYMGLGTILMIALIIAVFAIKAKINAIHDRIEEKLRALSQVVDFGDSIIRKFEDLAERHRK